MKARRWRRRHAAHGPRVEPLRRGLQAKQGGVRAGEEQPLGLVDAMARDVKEVFDVERVRRGEHVPRGQAAKKRVQIVQDGGDTFKERLEGRDQGGRFRRPQVSGARGEHHGCLARRRGNRWRQTRTCA